VDLPVALLARLQDLAANLGQNDQDLEQTLAALTAALRAAATSYCGFELTIVKHQWPVTLTAFSDGHNVAVRTSLRLPLTLVSQAFEPESRVVFFAVTPGALTDLAADLSHALGGVPVEQQSPAAYSADRGKTCVDSQPNAIALDSDPPVPPVSGLAGLAELMVLNRAIGMLIDQGHDIEQAHQVLRRAAAAAGVEPHCYAMRIVRSRMRPP
jgi:hypothetical protein